MSYTIHYFYSELLTGGIETLIVRQANWLIKNNFKIILHLSKPGKLDHLLDPNIKIIYNNNLFNFRNNISLHTRYINENDVVQIFRPNALFLLYTIFQNININIRVSIGFFHLYEVTYSAGFKNIFLGDYKKLLHYIPVTNWYFINEPTKKRHEEILGYNLDSSVIIPVPVSENLNNFDHKPKKFKIVSIGNLRKFKTYNLTALNVIYELAKKYDSISYDIFGAGELYNEMKIFIEKNCMESIVTIHKQLEYENYSQPLRDAYVFIGLGTSVLEAAILGIPSIVALVNDKVGLTNGWVHNLNKINFGEEDETIPKVYLIDLLEDVINMDNEEYKRISMITKSKVKIYSIDSVMREIIKHYDQLLLINNIKWNPTKYHFHYLLNNIIRKTIITINRIIKRNQETNFYKIKK